MIIDTHTHVWPDAIASKALGANELDLDLSGDGTVRSLLNSMASTEVDVSVCLAVANTAGQVERANAFAGSLPQPLLGLGAIHPDRTPEVNVESLRRHGLKGVKVHPPYQGFPLDDERFLATLDAMRGEFAVVIHVGEAKDEVATARCTPRMLRDLARKLPGLDIIACHFGGYHQLDVAEELVVGESVYLDTCWPPGLGTLPRERVRDLILRHGPERVLFASDWPTAHPQREIETLRNLGLDDETTAAILGGNAARIFGLESTLTISLNKENHD